MIVDFKLSDEQQMIKDSVDRFVSERASTADRWAEFAELGWLGIGAPEELGGFGGALETAIVMEAFGRGLVAEPYLTGAVLAGTILRSSGRNDLLEGLVSGRERFAVAFEEQTGAFDPKAVATRGAGDRVSGRKVRVIGARAATSLLVSATAGERIALFAVPMAARGVNRHDAVGEDGRDAATIEFDDVPAERVGAWEDLELGLDYTQAALAAEAVGIMTAMHDLTLRYLKERKQFGVAIGSFQALQHRMAEMFIELELARSMAFVATLAVTTDHEPAERARKVSAAKVQIARSGRFIGQNAIQLHGAIAMADEYKIGGYFKRMTMLERLFGDTDYHLARYLALGQPLTASARR